ncbi:AAA family ATPase, partial [candidate division KSB1 bacterium]|nr:AAA family ATPase [candidate division KSB1 bacterium]
MQKFLPIGISNFKEMIRGNFVYVDKTQYIYEMVRIPQAFYFLSRPRRFGKSLLVSTLKSLFEGKRELFKDLWINQTDWNWEKKLVIVFDFNQISSDTPENLKTGLRVALNDFGQLHGIKLKHELLKEKFKELVVNLKLKSGDKIIILVDEYDKPIIEHIGRGEKHLKIAELNRDILKQFFGVLKGIDVSAALRLVFITGISKFSGVSIFSDLNNLDDLSMKDSYADLSGYTEGELKKYFDGYVNKLATALNIDKSAVYNKIKEWYNGYRFSDRDINVFNPFSVINLLSNDKFKNYW